MAQDKQHLITEQLSAFLDREASAEEQARWEAHLSTCPQCQQALADLRQTVALLHALPQPTLSRSFVLPVEAAISNPASAAPTPIRPAKRRLNPYVRGVLRTMSALAAVIGVVFLLSGLLPALGHGGSAGTSSSTASSGVVRPEPPSSAAQHTTPRTTEKTLTPAIKATATGSQVVQPQPTNTSDRQPATTEPSTSSSWPTFFIFNLSAPAGRLGLGMLLVILGIMGFVVFKRAGRVGR